MAISTTASGPKDTTFTKIFVGGLPYHTTDQSLRDFFEQFGSIEEAVVITDRNTGKSKGYGFVTMADKGAAERACEDPNPIIDGRKANVNLAYLGAKPRTFQPTFPYNLQGLQSGLLHGQNALGLPPVQYVLTPAGYVATSPGTVPSTPQNSMAGANALAAAGITQNNQFVDYSGVSGYQHGQLSAMGYDTQQAARYMSPSNAAYYAYTTPQLMGRGVTQFQSGAN